MNIDTEKLSGNALDWAVGMASGLKVGVIFHRTIVVSDDSPIAYYMPSTDWVTGGQIIVNERIDICHHHVTAKVSTMIWFPRKFAMTGDAKDVLVLAMRCYVASKLGETVNIPNELINF